MFVAQARSRRLSCRVEAPARGLPRPVLLPPPRPGHAGGRNRVGHGHAGPPGQGAVLGHVRVAGRTNPRGARGRARRTEEHTSELQSLMRTSYAVFSLKKKTHAKTHHYRVL